MLYSALMFPRILVLLLLAFTLRAGNTVIVQFTAGTLHNSSPTYIGQSFATPAVGGPWNNLTFAFLADSTAYATGTAYLFTQPLPYGAFPSTLSPALSGFVAASTGISNGQYIFHPLVALQPNTVYYLYEDAVVPVHVVSGGAILFGPGSCCTASFASSATSGYFPDIGGGSANFFVTGTLVTAGVDVPTAVGAPTLSTSGLIACAMFLMGLGAAACRRLAGGAQ
jgi:hypothetical protein